MFGVLLFLQLTAVVFFASAIIFDLMGSRVMEDGDFPNSTATDLAETALPFLRSILQVSSTF